MTSDPMAVLRWFVVGTGAKVFSRPMRRSEALRIYHAQATSYGERSDTHSSTVTVPEVFCEGTPAYTEAIKELKEE